MLRSVDAAVVFSYSQRFSKGEIGRHPTGEGSRPCLSAFDSNLFFADRRYLLKEAQSALAEAQFRRMQIQERIRKAREHMSEQWLLWEEEQKKGMVAFQFLSFQEYIVSLERQLHTMGVELGRATIEADKRKEVVIERDKAVKKLESLEKDRPGCLPVLSSMGRAETTRRIGGFQGLSRS